MLLVFWDLKIHKFENLKYGKGERLKFEDLEIVICKHILRFFNFRNLNKSTFRTFAPEKDEEPREKNTFNILDMNFIYNSKTSNIRVPYILQF